MKLAQTQQPPHLVPLLELLEADDALLRLTLLAHAVLLRRLVHQHAVASRHPPRPRALGVRRSGRTADTTTIATTTATATTATTTTTTARPVSRRHSPCPYPSRSSSSHPTPHPGRRSRRPRPGPGPRKMHPNTLHHMLLALRLPAIEPTRREFVPANRTLVLFRNLALRLLLLRLLVRLWRSQGCRGRGWR